MLKDNHYAIEDALEVELDEAKENLARDYAQEIIAAGNKRVTETALAVRSGFAPRSEHLQLFTLRTRYYLQSGWRFMVVCEKGGLRVLSEAERAQEAVRRARLGARKVVRAQNALHRTDRSQLTRAQIQALDVAENAVSRQARALRSAQRQEKK